MSIYITNPDGSVTVNPSVKVAMLECHPMLTGALFASLAALAQSEIEAMHSPICGAIENAREPKQ